MAAIRQDDDVQERIAGRAAILTLNRPGAGNRLTEAMRAQFSDAVQRHDRNREIYGTLIEAAGDGPFSLGDDAADWARITALGPLATASALTGAATGIYRIDRFGKPFVAFMDGQAAGAALGLVLHGTHRVASDAVTLAVTDVAEGRSPGAGFSLSLPQLPGHIGLYMGLTGRPIDRSLAFALGLLTHCIDRRHFPSIVEQFAQAEPVDAVLDGLHQAPAQSSLEPHRETIERCFSAGSVSAIVGQLDSQAGTSAAWARELAADLRGMPQTALEETHAMLTGAPPQNLRTALALEFRASMSLAVPEESGWPDLVLPPEPKPPSID
jgi:enoyl-CoA hydratase